MGGIRFGIALAALGAAWAAGAADRSWPSERLRGQISEQPPCTCRSPTGAVDLGKEVCLPTPGGGRRARCVMVLNNTSWAIGEEGCAVLSGLTQ